MTRIRICISNEMTEKFGDLNKKELYILTLIAEGKTNRQIAEDMKISVHTVKAHVAAILQKMDVEYRVQAVIKALSQKLIEII